jgi:hypothetical protein
MPDFGHFVCQIIEDTANILPASPFTFKDLVEQASTSMPGIGGALIADASSMLVQVGGLVAFYKILKILPGKF